MVLKGRVVMATVAGCALALGLSSCVDTTDTSVNNNASTSRPSASSAPDDGATSTPTPTRAPVFVAGGTAEQNKPIFDATNQQYFIASGNVIPEGRGVIDNLVSVGFDKASMQLTPDRTAIDLPVDSLIFSVLMGDECLIGQFSALGYSTIVAPKLTTGTCLIGVTRTIDW
jgi:hypothetical protein